MKSPLTMFFRHRKSGKVYRVMGRAVNCTNAQDGQELVLYCCWSKPSVKLFAREESEFLEKFTPLSAGEVGTALQRVP